VRVPELASLANSGTRTEDSHFRYPYLAVAMSYAVAGGRSQGPSRQEIGFGTKVLASLVRVIKREEKHGFEAPRWYSSKRISIPYHHMQYRLRSPNTGMSAAEAVWWDDPCTTLHTSFREFYFHALG
jgi:hypothetical protein